MFHANALVMTVPLGVLKRPERDGGIRFTPPLPPAKLEAFDRLGFGVLNKARRPPLAATPARRET